jgi:hypothetical protein
MLNDHLGSEEGPKNKRLKRTAEGQCFESKPRSELIQDTASSHHEEETASLGKRSIADSNELRLCGKRKNIGHFLESISMLEGVISGLESSSFKSEKAQNELTSADMKTVEVKVLLTQDHTRLTPITLLASRARREAFVLSCLAQLHFSTRINFTSINNF